MMEQDPSHDEELIREIQDFLKQKASKESAELSVTSERAETPIISLVEPPKRPSRLLRRIKPMILPSACIVSLAIMAAAVVEAVVSGEPGLPKWAEAQFYTGLTAAGATGAFLLDRLPKIEI